MVSSVTRAHFPPLTNAEAVHIAQLIISLCGGQDEDPREEARLWVTEFIANAGAVVEISERDLWAVLREYERVEHELPRHSDIARCSAIIRARDQVWLPAARLKAHSGARMSWGAFSSCLREIGWQKRRIEVREPATRAERADGSKPGRICRNFYLGAT